MFTGHCQSLLLGGSLRNTDSLASPDPLKLWASSQSETPGPWHGLRGRQCPGLGVPPRPRDTVQNGRAACFN